MKFKTLQLDSRLREEVYYSSHSIPISICIDHFDDYLHREWPCHWHDEFEFVLVLKGRVEFACYDGGRRSDTRILGAGDGAFINSGFLHNARGLEAGTIMAGFVFPISFFDLRPFGSIHQKSILPVINCGVGMLTFSKDRAEDQMLLSAMGDLTSWNDEDSCFELHCIEMVCRIWRLLDERICREAPALGQSAALRLQEQRMKELVSYIHAHFSDNISIEELAKHANISRTECFRCFQSIMGKTPGEYIMEYRLSMATMMLTTTRRTVSDIAVSCGFCSPSYFGKIFKRECRLSPKRYREQSEMVP